MSTHDVVLETPSIIMFLTADLLLIPKASLGAELIAELLRLSKKKSPFLLFILFFFTFDLLFICVM